MINNSKIEKEIFFEQNERYKGEINQKNEFHGTGIYYFSDNSSFYKGKFRNGQFEGEGTLNFNGIKLEGNFKENMANGYCKISYEDGSSYEGKIKDNEKNGMNITFKVNL